MQSNSCRRPGEPCLERAAECDVVHEGVLDLQQNAFMSTEWVKYEPYLFLRHLLKHLLCLSVVRHGSHCQVRGERKKVHLPKANEKKNDPVIVCTGQLLQTKLHGSHKMI